MRFQPGLDGVTPKDVTDAMSQHPDNPLGYARGLLGDTKTTRDALAIYQAKRQSILCKKS